MRGRDWYSLRETARFWRPEPLPVDLLVLFDVDGTLLDSAGRIADTMVAAFRAAGEAPPDRSAVQAAIGLSVPEMVGHLAANATPDRREKILAGYRLRFADDIARETEPPVFPSAEDAILRLRRAGLCLGLATGKSRLSVDRLLDVMGWHGHFQTVQCADDNPSKPDPAMIHRALRATGRAAGRTVLVGDTRYDMRMAAAAGIRAIGVAWGCNASDDLHAEGATAIAADFRHLTDILMELVP
ncbi:MAG: HAD-IA family hydrolase [Pseudomonadota bacterium]